MLPLLKQNHDVSALEKPKDIPHSHPTEVHPTMRRTPRALDVLEDDVEDDVAATGGNMAES
jgi:hypothetical protein